MYDDVITRLLGWPEGCWIRTSLLCMDHNLGRSSEILRWLKERRRREKYRKFAQNYQFIRATRNLQYYCLFKIYRKARDSATPRVGLWIDSIPSLKVYQVVSSNHTLRSKFPLGRGDPMWSANGHAFHLPAPPAYFSTPIGHFMVDV